MDKRIELDRLLQQMIEMPLGRPTRDLADQQRTQELRSDVSEAIEAGHSACAANVLNLHPAAGDLFARLCARA